jgi:hypothetical protein
VTSFVGGLRLTSVLTEHEGRSHGMQVSLTPPGTRFREEIGLAPKALGRLMRFELAAAMLSGGMPPAQA